MYIKMLTKNEINRARDLFNKIAYGELVYKKLDEECFLKKFINEEKNIQKINLTAVDDDKIVGFANGCYKTDTNTGYVTFVAIEKEYRNKGIGRNLLKELHDELYDISQNLLKKFDIIFFNPINLEWCVPHTDGHDHPNSPGVDVSCDGYLFLKNCGYRDTVYQNSFYQTLENFEFSQNIKERLEKLKQDNITITYFDKEKHFGLDELFDDLGNEQWREIIMGNLKNQDCYPVLIAQHNNKAIGFTGPLYVQESKRGYFAGIGIHSEYRKFGLGKALFSSLCMSLKDLGADYMTLFTGETNPARNIYESAGFKIVKTWADMEYVIK